MSQNLQTLLDRISMDVLGVKFKIILALDKKYGKRYFLQVEYDAPCSKSGEMSTWKGRKWYLSSYMTAGEIVNTAFCALEAAVKHEILEGFKVDGKPVFNPHVSFEELIKISHIETTRNHVS